MNGLNPQPLAYLPPLSKVNSVILVQNWNKIEQAACLVKQEKGWYSFYRGLQDARPRAQHCVDAVSGNCKVFMSHGWVSR